MYLGKRVALRLKSKSTLYVGPCHCYRHIFYYWIVITDAFTCKQHFNVLAGLGGVNFNYIYCGVVVENHTICKNTTLFIFSVVHALGLPSSPPLIPELQAFNGINVVIGGLAPRSRPSKQPLPLSLAVINAAA